MLTFLFSLYDSGQAAHYYSMTVPVNNNSVLGYYYTVVLRSSDEPPRLVL